MLASTSLTRNRAVYPEQQKCLMSVADLNGGIGSSEDHLDRLGTVNVGYYTPHPHCIYPIRLLVQDSCIKS